MKISKFEDIIAWQKSKEMTLFVYKIFKHCKDYSFRDQIQRASVFVINNIAEGFERRTNKEFVNFLYIAKGSCGEIRLMSGLAYELKYISEKDKDYLVGLSLDISRLISGFIKVL